MKSLCFIATLAIIASGAIAQDAPRGQGRGGNNPGGRGGAPTAEMIKEFDKDGDGKLSEDERTAMRTAFRERAEKARAEREKEFDKDGDGKLNDEERKAMMDANRERMEQFRKEREKEFDKDGDGKLNDEERAAMMAARPGRGGPGAPGGIPGAGFGAGFGARGPAPDSPQFQEMIKRFDKDGDGKLSDEERRAMRDARRAAPPAAPAAPAPAPAPAAPAAPAAN